MTAIKSFLFRSSSTWLVRIAWVSGILIIVYHSMFFFYIVTPTDHWMKYYSIVPIKTEFAINETLKFISHTDLYKPLAITFDDILYCENPKTSELERYSTQRTHGGHKKLGVNRYTVWPYNPGVAFETKCCLESSITLHLPLRVDRQFEYNGCEEGYYFNIKENKDDARMENMGRFDWRGSYYSNNSIFWR